MSLEYNNIYNHYNYIKDMYNKYIIIYRSDKIKDNQGFVNEYFTEMKNEWNRLLTFQHGWDFKINEPSRLAFAGFFYLFCDRVQCAFCKSIVYNWSKGEDPVETHARHFPRCPYVMGDDVGNIPINSDMKLYDSVD